MSSGVTRSSIMPTTKVALSVSSFTLRESLVMIMVNSRRGEKNRSNQVKNVHNYFAELIACFAKTHRETLKVSGISTTLSERRDLYYYYTTTTVHKGHPMGRLKWQL